MNLATQQQSILKRVDKVLNDVSFAVSTLIFENQPLAAELCRKLDLNVLFLQSPFNIPFGGNPLEGFCEPELQLQY